MKGRIDFFDINFDETYESFLIFVSETKDIVSIMPTINIILANVEGEQITLPSFQRGYVWGRRQVRDLFDSLYKGNPVGSLLTWLTTRDGNKTELLLDGQQRVTSLYGVIKGKPPKFFSGDAWAFKDLHFHVLDQKFEFYQPIKMKGDLYWFDVTKVMQSGPSGIADLIKNQFAESEQPNDLLTIMQALNQLVGIADKNFHVEQIAHESKDVDWVVDIFNRLNSAGTRLSKGDLALAKISAQWSNVRNEMRNAVGKWNKHGFYFSLDWLLRCVNAVVNGEADFKHLHNTDREVFENGLQRTIKYVDTLLNQISGKLGLDHDRVLFAKNALPVLVRHLELCDRTNIDASEWNLILYWYLHVGIQGRFSTSSEGRIRQDLVTLDGTLSGIEKLISEIGTSWGRPQILPADFDTWSIGARTYPALYWMTRMGSARNFCDGNELRADLIGKGAQLNVHHIFSKAELYDWEYDRTEVNAIGNFCFLTAGCNQWISAALPAQSSEYVRGTHDPELRRIGREGYFNWVREKHPGVLESQWIPMDEELWKIENYQNFLHARRQLLANAANGFLRLLNPKHPVPEIAIQKQEEQVEPIQLTAHIASIEEEEKLRDAQEWIKSLRLSSGHFGYEIGIFPEEGKRAIIDLAWPKGIREGLDRPVALLLNESAETYQTVSQAGYDCFVDIESFKKYVESEIIGGEY